MVVFDVGSVNSDISKELDIEYKDSVDLISGIVFVYKKKIVYSEKFPYYPENPNKLWFYIENKFGEPNIWYFTPDNAVLEGSKSETNGKYYYEIKPLQLTK